MEGVLGEFLLLFSLSIIAALYASVGHGGASGYLAVLSLTIYAANDPGWLKRLESEFTRCWNCFFHI